MIAAVADTHTIIWYIFQDQRLSNKALEFIEHAAKEGRQIAIASITLVEIVYLVEKERIAAETFSRVSRLLEDTSTLLVEIPLDLKIARALSQVDAAQIPDLPDRIIAATALNLEVPLISRDSKIQFSSIHTIW